MKMRRAGSGLEWVFSEGHRYRERIFYDPREGAYYDRWTDMFLTVEEARGFGLGVAI